MQADNLRLCEGVAQVLISGAVELPEQLDRPRIGDVEGEKGLAASTQGADQYGTPAFTIPQIHIADDGGAVNEVLVLAAAVVLCGKAVQVLDYFGGNEGEFLHPRGGIETVQHAVVAADIDHFLAPGDLTGVAIGPEFLVVLTE